MGRSALKPLVRLCNALQLIHAHQIKTYNFGACHLNGLCTSAGHCIVVQGASFEFLWACLKAALACP